MGGNVPGNSGHPGERQVNELGREGRVRPSTGETVKKVRISRVLGSPIIHTLHGWYKEKASAGFMADGYCSAPGKEILSENVPGQA